MKKRLMSIALALCLLLSLLPPLTINAAAMSGDGTAASPYQIASAADLAAITDHPSACYVLTQNITLTGEWTPITSFSGVLDGNGHTISGLSMTPTYEIDENYYYSVKSVTSKALIMTLDKTGVIKNLTLSGAKLNTIAASTHQNHINTNSALLVATNKGTITTCTLDSCIVNGYETSVPCAAHEGGFTWDNQGSLLNCIVTGTSWMTVGWDADYVDGDMGFMAGRNTGTIANCVVKGRAFTNDIFSGMVSGMPAYLKGAYTSSAIGGIVGKNNTGGRVYNCYFYGMFCPNSGAEDFNYTTGLVIGQNNGGTYASIDAVPGAGDSTHTNKVTHLVGDIPGSGYVAAAGTATRAALVATFNAATTANSMSITGLLPMKSGTEFTIDTDNAAMVTLQNTSPSGGSVTQYIAKGSYTIPTYTDESNYVLWSDGGSNTGKKSGDTITISADTTLTGAWSAKYLLDTTAQTVTPGGAYTVRTKTGSAALSAVGGTLASIQYKVNNAYTTTAPTASGTYDVKLTFSGLDAYKSNVSDNTAELAGGFVVAKIALTSDNATTYLQVDSESAAYTGAALSTTVSAKSGKPTGAASDFTITYKQGTEDVASPTEPGSYDVYAAAAGTAVNYSTAAAVKVGTFTINKAASNLTLTVSPALLVMYPGEVTMTATFTLPSATAAAPTGTVTFISSCVFKTETVGTAVFTAGNGVYTATCKWKPTDTSASIGGGDFYLTAKYTPETTETHYNEAAAQVTAYVVDTGDPDIDYFNIPASITVDYGADYDEPDITPKDGSKITLQDYDIEYDYGRDGISATRPTKAGTYDVVIAFNGNDYYKPGLISTGMTITINKANPAVSDFTMNAYTPSPVYDGKIHGYSFEASGTAAGTITTGKTGMGTVTVQYAAKTGADAYDTANMTEKQPIDAGTYGVYVTTTAGDNYTAAATPILLGDMTIDKVTLTEQNFSTYYTYADSSDLTYSGTAKSASLTGKNDDYDGLGTPTLYYSTTDAKGSTTAPTNAGTYYVYASFTAGDNFNSVSEASAFKVSSFTIEKADPTVTVTAVKKNGTAVPTGTIVISNPNDSPGASNTHTYYKLTYEDTVTFDVTVEGVNGEKPTGTASIQYYNGSGDVISTQDAAVVDGKATLTVKVGNPLHAAADAASGLKSIYAHFVTGAGETNSNYADNKDSSWGEYYIAPKPVTFNVSGTELTYDGSAKTISFTEDAADLTPEKNFKVSYYKVDENEGVLASATPVMKAVAAGKYLYVIGFNETAQTDYTISRPYTVSGTALPTLSDYDNVGYLTIKAGTDAQQKPIYFADSTVTKAVGAEAFKNALTNENGTTPTYRSSKEAVATVGTDGTVTVVGEGTTTITATSTKSGAPDVYASFTLNVVKDAVTVTVNDKSIAYGTATPTDFTVTLSNGATLTDAETAGLTFTTTYTAGKGVGEYSVKAGGLSSARYAFVYEPGTLTVNPKKLTISDFDLSAQNKTYDGTTAAAITATFKADALYTGDSVKAVAEGSFVNETAGEGKTVTITISGLTGTKAANYELTDGALTGSATAAISKARLTVNCASATTVDYDGSAKSANVTVYVDGKLFTDYTVNYTLRGESESTTEPTAVGTYDISVVPTDATNYATPTVYATLTIKNAAQEAFEIIGVPDQVVYGDPDFTLSTAGTDANAGVTYTSSNAEVAAVSGSTVTIVKPGTVTITATSKLAGYADRTKTVTFTVQKKPITITAKDVTMTYGETFSANGYTASPAMTDGQYAGTAAYTTNYAQTKGAGSYTIALSGLTSEYYVFTYEPGTLTVSPKLLTSADFIVAARSKTYDGSTAADITASVKSSAIVNNDTLGVTVTGAFANADAGTQTVNYTITGLTGTKAANYMLENNPLSGTVTADITQAGITFLCAARTSRTYDGTAQSVDVSAMANGMVFDRANYTVQYTGNGETTTEPIVPGTYEVSIVLSDAYKDNYHAIQPTATLVIQNAAQDGFAINELSETAVYGAAAKLTTEGAKGTVTFELTAGGDCAALKGDTLTFLKPGTFTVQATSRLNGYTDKTATRTFTVFPKELTPTVTATDRTYDGTTTVAVTAEDTGIITADQELVTIAATGNLVNADAGSGKLVYVKLSLSGEKAACYTLTNANVQTTVDIARREITAFTITAQDKSYDATTAASAVVTGITGVLDADAGMVNIAGSACFDTAQADIDKTVTFQATGLTGSGAGNYILMASAASTTATIRPMQITFTVGATSFKYDGTAKNVEITAENENGRKFTDFTVRYSGENYLESETAPKNAGTYTVSVALGDNENYTSDWTDQTLTITKTTQEQLTIVGLPGTVQYGDSFELEAFGGSGDGSFTWSSDHPEVEVTGSTAKATVTVNGAVGEKVTISVTRSADNYTDKTAAVVFIPGKKSISFILSNLNQTYDGTEKAVTVTPGSGSGNYTVTYNGSDTAPTEVGTYQVVVTATGNYSGTATGTLTIRKATLTGLTVSQKGWIYGGTKDDAVISGIVPSGVASVITYSTADGKAPVDAGRYTVTATFTGKNYDTFTATAQFVVARKELTVTADDAERQYGEANPVFTVKYDGFVGTDDVNSLTSEPVTSCSANAASPVGSYSITVAGGSAENYRFNYVSGTLKVTQATSGVLTILGANNSAYVGDSLTLHAYLGGQPVSVIWNSNAPEVASIGTDGTVTMYKEGEAILSATLNNANYDLAPATFRLTVSKKAVNLTPGKLVTVYNGIVQSISLTSDTEDFTPEIGANVTVSYTLTTDPNVLTPKQAGTYLVTYTIVSDSYKGSGTTVLYINKATVAVTADSLRKTYGADNPPYTLTGLLGDDRNDADYTAKLWNMFTVSSGADATGAGTPAGSYPITVALKDGHSLTEDRNYNFTIGAVQGSLTVDRAPLAVNVPDVTRAYGKENPAPAITYSGFMNGENESVLGGNLRFTYADSVTPESPVGTYPDVLTVSGLTSGNYDITYAYTSGEAADLTITKLPVSLSGSGSTSALTMQFTEPVPGAAFTVTDSEGKAVEVTAEASADNRTYILNGTFEGGKTYTVIPTVDTDRYDLSGASVGIPVTIALPGSTVTVQASENGSVTADKAIAVAGEIVVLTVTPNEGYTLEHLTVTDKNGAAVEVSEQSGSYRFTMPQSDVTVEAGFKEIASDFPFVDVSETYWAREAIAYTFHHGLFSGTSATTFSPETTMTRGMLVTVLWQMAGKPIVKYDMNFTDVSAKAYYAEAVRWAACNKIVSGYSNGSFGPKNAITREQMAAILYQYASFKGYDVSGAASLAGFDDSDSVSAYARTAMAWAVDAGLIQGSDNKLMPHGDATRAQAAVILQRFLQNVVK